MMVGRHGKAEGKDMKHEPATGPPDKRTPYERFLDLARKVVRTPKDEVAKREQAWREKRRNKRS
jgi:hypothetical protein